MFKMPHAGEDHGDAPVQAVITSSTPRLSTQTDQFELVGVLQDKVLTLYLDQFGTNTDDYAYGVAADGSGVYVGGAILSHLLRRSTQKYLVLRRVVEHSVVTTVCIFHHQMERYSPSDILSGTPSIQFIL